MKLILASQSVYRGQLLAKLRLPFIQEPSDLDELVVENEPPEQRALRLSQEKADRVAARFTGQDYLVIGSDQVACVDGVLLHKPGNFENARRQLLLCQGKTVCFYTGCAVVNAETGLAHHCVDKIEVAFRALAESEINRYLELEQPYDCAGSFKVEGLGITLFEAIRCDDPNALVGLPLIGLCRLLRLHGYDPADHAR